MSIWEELTGYLSFSFVQYALIASVLIALCSSLLGVTLVLKRFSVIGDGLSHVAFGALAIATVLRLSNSMLLVMPVTVACAVILLCANQSAKIKGDAAIAMLSVSALALGYLVQNLFSSSANISGDVCSTLFGSTLILTLSTTDVWVCVGMSIVVMAIFLLFYHKIFAGGPAPRSAAPSPGISERTAGAAGSIWARAEAAVRRLRSISAS